MATVVILDFLKFEILLVCYLAGGQCVIMLLLYFMKIRRRVVYIYSNCFPKWLPSAISDLLGAHLDHPR